MRLGMKLLVNLVISAGRASVKVSQAVRNDSKPTPPIAIRLMAPAKSTEKVTISVKP